MFDKWKSRAPSSAGDSKPPLALLVVTASPADRASLRRIFETTSWEMLTADNLEQASTLLGARPIPIVLCDRDLPGVDWRQAVRRLADGQSRVMLTSFVADDYLWDEVIRYGGYDVISKPFREDEVLHTVQFAWAAIMKSLP